MKKIFCIALLFSCLTVVGQNSLNLVPMPAEVKMGKGNFVINKNTKIAIQSDKIIANPRQYTRKDAEYLRNHILTKYNLNLSIVEVDPNKKNNVYKQNIIILLKDIDTRIPNNMYQGSYSHMLNISKNSIYLVGSNDAIFHGIQTLKQLIEHYNPLPTNKLSIPQLSITDAPRFQYRGIHLDVARHFYPISFIKKYIDYLAAYKFNTFHWHLTDDQGWRIEIKKYPKLTQVGGYRNGTIIGRYPGKGNDSLHYGGFYTQAQIKDIVQYAADRYITVIPEIEMPGHASAAIAAYPQLSCFPNEDTQVPKGCTWSGSTKGKQVQQTWGVFDDVFAPTDYTFNFLQDVLDEVITLFPSKYIHIGGDECPKENWKRSEFCQQLIKDNNLKDEHGLQSYFINRIEKYLNGKGKNIIGWDEILEGGLAPNATVMSWRGEAGGIEAAKQKHNVIMTPGKPVYFDHSQSKNEDSVTIGGYNSLEDVYNYEPVPKELNTEQAKYILGAQANLWTEYIKNERKVEYQLFPRLFALSEVLWSPKEKRNWNDFEKRLPALFKSLDDKKINYSKAYYDLEAKVLPRTKGKGVIWQLKSKNKNDKICTNSLIGTGDVMINEGLVEIPVTNDAHLLATICTKDNLTKSITQKFYFNKATGKKITLATEASKNYPGDGAFTLVNGVQNEKGLAKSSEFLGFNGTDLDATIDFGKATDVSTIKIHTLNQNGSWIYLPSEIQIECMPFIDPNAPPTRHAPIETFTFKTTPDNNLQVIKLPQTKTCGQIRVIVKNYGMIPSGNPGAGNKAWLFVDEIEVE